MEEMNQVPANEAGAAPEAGVNEADLQARIEALEQREQALNRQEREARCRAGLRERSLPEALLTCLDLSSDERAEETLGVLAVAFSDAVEACVRNRLGAEPPRASAAVPEDPLAAVRRAMGLGK